LISFRRPTVSGYSVSVTLRLPAILRWFLFFGHADKRVGRAGSPSNRGKAVGARELPRNIRTAVPLVSSMKFARMRKEFLRPAGFFGAEQAEDRFLARNDGARR
jgi:hypothetical protein